MTIDDQGFALAGHIRWYVVICEKWSDVFLGKWRPRTSQFWSIVGQRIQSLAGHWDSCKISKVCNDIQSNMSSKTYACFKHVMRWTVTVLVVSGTSILMHAVVRCSCPLQLSAAVVRAATTETKIIRPILQQRTIQHPPLLRRTAKDVVPGLNSWTFQLRCWANQDSKWVVAVERALYVAIFNTDNSLVRNKDTKCCERSLASFQFEGFHQLKSWTSHQILMRTV